MGLAGLGLACRSAATVVRLPPGFSEIWVWLGVLALAVLLPAWLLKLVRQPDAARAEFTNAAQLGFCATLPIALTLVAGGLEIYAPGIANLLWWAGVALLFAFQVWALARWFAGGVELGQVNGGWIIMLIGGIVVPSSGIALGNHEVSRFMFGASAAAAPVVMGLVFYRTVAGPPLSEALRPTWFIFLVPPSLAYANGAALSGGDAGLGLQSLYYGALVLAVALLIASARFWRWPFGAPWWAFTFSLDALASAAAHYARASESGLWRAIAAATLLLAVLAVVTVLVRTLSALLRGRPSG